MDFPSISPFKFSKFLPSVFALTLILSALVLGVVASSNKQANRKLKSCSMPPIVSITPEEQFGNPQAAYESGLAKYGPVIGVLRKGRLEYIVNDTLTQTVLTTDADFSFEEGTATILNFHYLFSYIRVFFQEMDELVRNGIVARLPIVIERIFLVFFQRTEETINKTEKSPDRLFDIFEHAHSSIAEAMIILVFGKEYVNPRNLNAAIMVAGDIANVTGLYQNTSIFARTFPALWRSLAWLRFIIIGIGFNFLRVFSTQIWCILRNRRWKEDQDRGPDNVIEFLAFRYADVSGNVSFLSTIWIFVMILGLLFASVHQSATVVVWVVFELAKRPEYFESLREEFVENVDPVTLQPHSGDCHEALRRAEKLDAFIREVFRTKGDTLSTCRRTTRDVPLGPYIIPKGHLVLPLASLSHENEQLHGEDAKVFRADRWEGENYKPAVMGSPSYYPFGLGRWACPGRFLAVAEIKMIVWAIIRKSMPRLKGDDYKVLDRMNVTSVPPEGELELVPLLRR